MTRRRPEGGIRGWANPGSSWPDPRSGPDPGDYWKDIEREVTEDPEFQTRLREGLLLARTGNPVDEIDAWWPSFLQAEAQLAPGWELLWQQGVPEGQEFRAHLVDPDGTRLTVLGSDHAAAFNYLGSVMILLRAEGARRLGDAAGTYRM
jgi:hypothetical protein